MRLSPRTRIRLSIALMGVSLVLALAFALVGLRVMVGAMAFGVLSQVLTLRASRAELAAEPTRPAGRPSA